ncbi:MAG: hypothetical protein GC181_08095 [Bacteroidetes bacterium]|nr:hypothetical protein [Bacteroidota bacterium]
MRGPGFLVFTIPLICNSCLPPKKDDGHKKDRILAKVYDQPLYESEAMKALYGKYTREDSATVFYEFIQLWIREQTIIQKAKQVLTDFEKDKADLVLKYYNDLLVYELQQKMVAERLDTTVDEGEISEYYENNKENFELKENILRLKYCKLKEPVADLEKLWRLFISQDADDQLILQYHVNENEGYFQTDDSTWYSFNDVLKEIPIITYNQESYLNNNKFIRFSDNGYSYYVHILDFRVKNNSSPLEFERQRIRDIILNKRKVELMQQIEDEIVEQTYKAQKVEIY